MKKIFLVGVLLGAMLVSMVGCKKQSDGGTKDSFGKTTKTETNQGEESPKSPTPEVIGEDMFLYKDEFYGFSFVVPKYTRGDYFEASYVRQSRVGADDIPQLEKFIAVHRYFKLSHEELVDINQINTVYDMPDVIAEIAFMETLRGIKSYKLLSYDIEVADTAETINGYEMLRYEGTMEVGAADDPYLFGITGYFILADGFPLVVQAVDSTDTVFDVEYESELSQMESLRAEVDAMVRTFSMEGWYGEEFR